MKFPRRPNLDALKGVVLKKRPRQSWFLIGGGFLLICLILWSSLRSPRETESVTLPNFAAIKDIKERKERFFAFLLPFAQEANEYAMSQRKDVIAMRQHHEKGDRLSKRAMTRLNELLLEYAFEEVEEVGERTFHDLLSRIDIIPPSLSLAQAALESGWGTSRFAQEGNNLFGVWCYEPGCGIVPKRRPPGKVYEVKSYSSPKKSFVDYIRNLNTNDSYSSMRAIRRALRRNDARLSGYDLADGLERYSQERWVYVQKVQSLIRSNGLAKFDQ